MHTKDQEFLAKLRATFRLEAAEHLQVLATALLELEKTQAPDARRQLVETAFRAAHSLKGAARAVDYADVESACEQLEDAFAGWRRRQTPPAPAELDRLHRTINEISGALAASLTGPAAVPTASEAVSHGPAAPARPAVVPPSAAAACETLPGGEETVRIPVAMLDARLLEAEEMIAAKLATRQRALDLEDLRTYFDVWRKEYVAIESHARTARTAERPPAAMAAGPSPAASAGRVLDFLQWNGEYLKALEDRVAALHRTAELDRQLVGRLVDQLLESSKKLLLMPFGTATMALPKLVRDLSRDLGKEADLHLRGEDVAVDKRVLEELRDPLVHLLRNALDHGIEPPEQRRQAGKRPRGAITVAASQVDGNTVLVTVTDDGAGIDPERVKTSAVQRGLISADTAQRLSAADLPRLIFEADVSTSAVVTRVSGRGLGLAIVREKVEKIGGSVSVESVAGEGTRFVLTLPSTLATFRGVLVEAAGQRFVIPTHLVERVVRFQQDEVHSIDNRETVAFGGRAVALVRLASLLALPSGDPPAAPQRPALLVGNGDHRMAFAVDAVLDEQEVLVKPLRPPLVRVRHVAGVTVLGSGQVVPILNVSDLVKSARKSAGAAAMVKPAAPPAAKSVLVAEDSITSRMLIKSILETAGYQVKTAVDGMDAWVLLRTGRFDLLVTDVEMPRLDGFELASRIRADARLAELPIVLVTALDTFEDRARGVDVAADAYIVKGSFDQRELLDTVRRLI